MAFDGSSVKVLRDIKKNGDSHSGKYVEFKDHLYFGGNSNSGRLKAYRHGGDSVVEVDFGLSVGVNLFPGPLAVVILNARAIGGKTPNAIFPRFK